MVTDLALARRLERAEGAACARFVEAHGKMRPELGATWIDAAGTYALFDGDRSPITQTFGLGMFAEATDGELEQLEQFFESRGAPVFHEVSPLADKSLWPLLAARGYRPVEFTSVMYQPLRSGMRVEGPRNERLRVRITGPEEADLWARTGAAGWATEVDFADLMIELGLATAQRQGAVSFLAEIDGAAVAAGALLMGGGGVALLAGASTIPQARQQGAQRALLEARLRYAAEAGCDLAMMGAEPGSGSQRNAERQGFRIGYTRVKWKKGE